MAYLGIMILSIYGIIIYKYTDFKNIFNENYGTGNDKSFFICIMSIIKDGFTLGLTNKLNPKVYD